MPDASDFPSAAADADLHNAVNRSALDFGLEKTYNNALQRVTDLGTSIPTPTPIDFSPLPPAAEKSTPVRDV